MRRIPIFVVVVLLGACAHAAPRQPVAPVPATPAVTPPATTPAAVTWQRHDPARPQPPIARPATAIAVKAPADAVVLFDGNGTDAWQSEAGGPVRWQIRDGALEIVPGTGAIRTTSAFGDVQLHIEWLPPLQPDAEGEARGNSGVVFMGKYEVQILDSYGNNVFADAQAGAIYGQTPPLVNASLPPGEWQSFDIVFHAPHFENGRLVKRARITVFQNGVLVQDDAELNGPTADSEVGSTTPHASQLPLYLQNGGQPVRFRNIWIRELSQGE